MIKPQMSDVSVLACDFLMRSLALMFTATLSWPASAAGIVSADDQELMRLQFAKSPSELERLEDHLNLGRTLDEDCRSELDLKVLPKSCFRSFQSRGLEAPSWLKADCVARAKASKSRVDLREGLDALPRACQTAARERLEDLHYLDASERPSEIWTLERNVK